MRGMKKFLVFWVVLGVILSWSWQALGGTEGVDLLEKVSFQQRWGFEWADYDDGVNDPAKALTVRTRLGFLTKTFEDQDSGFGFQAFAQLHNVAAIVDRYSPNQDGYDEVKDPASSDIGQDIDFHQLYMDIKFPNKLGLLRIGRQEIVLEDSRFIGNIDWRQHGQSFEGIVATLTPVPELTLIGAYVSDVKMIDGREASDVFADIADDLRESTNGTVDLEAGNANAYVFHMSYSGLKDHTLSLFAYLVDYPEVVDFRDSATYGFRVHGKVPFQDNLALRYDITYAYQTAFADDGDRNTSWRQVGNEILKEHGANFLNISLATDWKLDMGLVEMASFGFGYQMIEGADGSDKPFDTLVSTAHKWNGWADMFLATNNGALWNGLEDYWVEASVKFLGIKFLVAYHYFDSETKVDGYAVSNGKAFDDAYGQELDFLLVKTFNKNVKGVLKASFFAADSDAEDHFGNAFRDKSVFWARLMIDF